MKKLDKYLSGQMNEKEISDFTEVLIQQKFDEEKRNTWSQLLKENHNLERSGKTMASKRRKIPLARMIGVAASFLLLMGLGYYIMMPSTPEYKRLSYEYVQNLPITGDPSVIRKDIIEEEDVRLKANEAYVDGDFDAAVEYWEVLLSNDTYNTRDLFYLGISYLRKENADPAACIRYLKMVQERGTNFSQEINWVISLAYIELDDIDSARPILEQIVQNDEYMSAKAVILLEALPEN